jgi:ribosomal protein L23
MVRSQSPKKRENQVVFRVPLNVNKPQIMNYLEQIYQVKVKRVDTMIYLGKTKRSNSTGKLYKLKDYKKAVVILEDPFEFPTMEEQKTM